MAGKQKSAKRSAAGKKLAPGSGQPVQNPTDAAAGHLTGRTAVGENAFLALLSADSRRALRELAAGVPSTVSVLTGQEEDLVFAAAVTLGRFWVPAPYREVDLQVLEPDGRWDLTQIRERVVVAASVVPLLRRVLVIRGVQLMDRAGFDLLLKLFEDPPQGTVFVVTAISPQSLPATLMGRASATVAVTGVGDPAARTRLLVDHGWSELDAQKVATLRVPASWFTIFAESPVQRRDDLMSGFGRVRDAVEAPSGCARAAAEIAAVIDELAGSWGGWFGSSDSGERAAKRSLLSYVLTSVGEQAGGQLARGGDPMRVQQMLESVEKAHQQLAMNASPVLVLTVLLDQVRTSV